MSLLEDAWRAADEARYQIRKEFELAYSVPYQKCDQCGSKEHLWYPYGCRYQCGGTLRYTRYTEIPEHKRRHLGHENLR